MQAYGNFINRCMETQQPKLPKVGDGATMLMYSDRQAFTVIEVDPKGKWFKIQKDHAKNTKEYPAQHYEYSTDPDGYTETVKLRKTKGREQWYSFYICEFEGIKRTCWGSPIGVGYRDEYSDPSF